MTNNGDTSTRTNKYLAGLELGPMLEHISLSHKNDWDWGVIVSELRTQAKRRGFTDEVVDFFLVDVD